MLKGFGYSKFPTKDGKKFYAAFVIVDDRKMHLKRLHGTASEAKDYSIKFAMRLGRLIEWHKRNGELSRTRSQRPLLVWMSVIKRWLSAAMERLRSAIRNWPVTSIKSTAEEETNR
jgi:hypothetical protein